MDKNVCGGMWNSLFSYIICKKFKSQKRDKLSNQIFSYLENVQAINTTFLKVSGICYACE